MTHITRKKGYKSKACQLDSYLHNIINDEINTDKQLNNQLTQLFLDPLLFNQNITDITITHCVSFGYHLYIVIQRKSYQYQE